MAKINCNIKLEQTKPTVTAADIEAVYAWIQTNIMNKLPDDASATFTMHIES